MVLLGQFAGWVARQMGVPIRRLLVGSNRNDILPRFFSTGVMEMHEVIATTSPSMDIQVSSNFERLLYELSGRDPYFVVDAMERFRAEGLVDLGADLLGVAREVFDAVRVDDEEAAATIAATAERTGVVLDPHTAVGVAAAVAVVVGVTVDVVVTAASARTSSPRRRLPSDLDLHLDTYTATRLLWHTPGCYV